MKHEPEREVVEAILYSACSIILEQLLVVDDSEKMADMWLTLTARGMQRTPADLATSIHDHNERLLSTRRRTSTED